MATTTASRVNPHVAQKLLLAKRFEILSRLKGPTGALGHAGRVADDDQAPILHEEFVSLETNRIIFEQSKLVEAALRRIDTGDYGACLRCEGPISPKRLMAVPWASHCITCEEKISQAFELEEFRDQVA